MGDEIRGMPAAYWMERFARAEVGEIVGLAFHFMALEADERAERTAYQRERRKAMRTGRVPKPPRPLTSAELPADYANYQRVRHMMRLAERIGA